MSVFRRGSVGTDMRVSGVWERPSKSPVRSEMHLRGESLRTTFFERHFRQGNQAGMMRSLLVDSLFTARRMKTDSNACAKCHGSETNTHPINFSECAECARKAVRPLALGTGLCTDNAALPHDHLPACSFHVVSGAPFASSGLPVAASLVRSIASTHAREFTSRESPQ